ncbi:MAG TPA: class I SAM-dependent methyltransferase [Candidatus Binatia bacterium]
MQGERCPICAAALAPWESHAPDAVTGETFAILRCTGCGLGVTRPVPADLGRYYGPMYYGRRHGVTARYRCWRRFRLLSRHTPRPGRLLDVGCGEGDFMAFAAERGWQAAGTEVRDDVPDAEAHGLAVRRSIAEARELGPFDAITSWHSFEHFVDPVAEFDRLIAALADGGTLAIITPDFGGLQAKVFGRAWFHLDVPRHLFHFTRRALVHLFESRGLVVERIDSHEIEYDLFGWLQSLLNVLLPTQNQFFSWLTGKPHRAPSWEIALAVLLAVLFTPLALVATAVAIATRRGATVNVVARKPRTSTPTSAERDVRTSATDAEGR